MQLFMFDFEGSTLSQQEYALNMRTAFLLADLIILSGKAANSYDLVGNFYRYSLKDKFRVARQIKLPGALDAEVDLDVLWKTINELKNKKRKTVEDMKLLNSGEKLLDVTLKIVEDVLKAAMRSQGFMEPINELANSGFITFINMVADSEEIMEGEKKMKVTRLFISDPDEEEMPEDTDPETIKIPLFLLPNSFFDWCADNHTIYTAQQPEAANKKNIYMQSCFTLPHTQSLSVEEMKLARRSLWESSKPWRSIMNQWNLMEQRKTDSKTMVSWFRENMTGKTDALQWAINDNYVLQQTTRSSLKQDRVEVMAGEVPMEMIMEFYREKYVIPDCSYELLLDYFFNIDTLQKRSVVLALKIHGTQYSHDQQDHEKEETNINDLLTKKKFIQVD